MKFKNARKLEIFEFKAIKIHVLNSKKLISFSFKLKKFEFKTQIFRDFS